MKKHNAQLLITLAATACISLFIAGCAQTPSTHTQLFGAQSQAGNTQVYTQPTLPMPVMDPQPSATMQAKWGAIASAPGIAALTDPMTSYVLGISSVNNYASRQEAEKAALASCEADGIVGCQVNAVFQGQCYSFAFGHEHRAFAWAIHPEKEQADQQANKLCAQQNEGMACITFSTKCTDPANTLSRESFASSNPELAAKLAHTLAQRGLQDASARDQGTTYEQAKAQYNSDDIVGEQLVSQLQLIYGPFKNYSPEEIYRFFMKSYMAEFSTP